VIANPGRFLKKKKSAKGDLGESLIALRGDKKTGSPINKRNLTTEKGVEPNKGVGCGLGVDRK